MLEKSKIAQMNQNIDQHQTPAPLIKRLLAICYDSFLLIAVLFLAMGLLLLVSGGHEYQAGNPLITAYLLLVSFVFFGWFWTHGGQTLGMRAWKLRLQQRDGNPINWQHVVLRLITALPAWIVLFIGIALVTDIQLATHPWLNQLSALTEWLIFIVGIAWLIGDQWPDGWRDKISGTRIIKLK
jgi:uncharacterized RDD family membrane protein YckC